MKKIIEYGEMIEVPCNELPYEMRLGYTITVAYKRAKQVMKRKRSFKYFDIRLLPADYDRKQGAWYCCKDLDNEIKPDINRLPQAGYILYGRFRIR